MCVTVLLPDTHEPSYVITNKQQGDYYYLYKVSDDGSLEKIHKGKSPLEFDSIINYDGEEHNERQKKKKTH